ncbi:MAG: hypothetical protein E7A68_18980 [Phocaeicola vulgatus]|nr:hypothetical protein [Phocaeicola vulgatus]
MKQTVSIPATDINVVSKSSVLTMWLNRENQLFSSVALWLMLPWLSWHWQVPLSRNLSKKFVD